MTDKAESSLEPVAWRGKHIYPWSEEWIYVDGAIKPDTKFGSLTSLAPLYTFPSVAEAAGDGRPCSMDVFVAKLFEDCDDHYDRSDAIKFWLEGDWVGAMEYLSHDTYEALAAQTGGE